MLGEPLFVFGLLMVTVVLFASNRVRPDVVALLVIVTFVLSGVLTVAEAVAGFSDQVVLLIAVLFVVGEGLVRTGVAYALGEWLMRVSGRSETRLLILLMLSVAGLGAFMSSTGVVAIFIPVVLSIAAKIGASPGRLMMPLAFAALISGMLTLIGTPPNLIINGELRREGLETFGFFSFTPIGLLVLAVGIGYMLLAGRWLLPSDRGPQKSRRNRPTIRRLVELYGLESQAHRLRLPARSPLAGRTVAEARLRSRYGINVVGLERHERAAASLMPALADTELRPGDLILAIASAADAAAFCEAEGLTSLPLAEVQSKAAGVLGLAEVMLPPDSELIGHTLKQAEFRSRHGLSVLAIRRGGEPLLGNLIETKLAFGDIMLVAGGWKQIRILQSDQRDFLVLNLPAELDEVAPARNRARHALLCVLGMIVLMTFGVVPNLVAVLLAALAMGLFRCVDMENAYKSINWPSLVLIAGMLPFATALTKTGGVDLIVHGLMSGLGNEGPYAMMAGLFGLSAVIGLFISNTATAVLMAPIAVTAAQQMGVAPYPFAMTVAIAASAAFVTPVSSPVNTLVLVPGGYQFNDFVKVGLPMLLLVMAVTLVFVPLIFPF